jgi:hypothetical protein
MRRAGVPQLYEPFFADFGPLNLGLAYRYCTKLHQLLEVSHISNRNSGRRLTIRRRSAHVAPVRDPRGFRFAPSSHLAFS